MLSLEQQDFMPPLKNDAKQLENKILLLYLIEKMDLPLSANQIAQFVQEENYMNIYTVRLYLREMVDIGYLEISNDNNTLSYIITDEGAVALEAFMQKIPPDVKSKIIQYVSKHRNIVKKDFEVLAIMPYNHLTNEYEVKCSVCEDKITHIELKLSVVSREQALLICNNWRDNITAIYGQIFGILTHDYIGDDD